VVFSRSDLDLHMDEIGYFLFSLDTELAVGHFDLDNNRKKRFSIDGKQERRSIYKLIDLFEEYNIVGTWAVVGHLFYNQCEYCEDCPMMDWRGKLTSFEEVYGTNNPLWYGSDIIEVLQMRGPRQEIAFHGYSHKIFDENQMTKQDASIEIQEWLRVAKRKGIIPHAVVFPRNVKGHLDLLKEAGMLCYRGEPRKPFLIRNKVIGKYFKAMDQILSISKLPTFDTTFSEDHGMVNLCTSQCFFDLNRGFEHFLDSLNLHNLRFGRVIRGIKSAGTEKKILHLWAHPCDFHTEKDFEKLCHIFTCVSDEVKRGRLKSVGMTEMARLISLKNASII
jgi:hypothetical protein